MKAVVQRVTQASVTVDGKIVSQIKGGLLTLLGIAKGDTEEKLAKVISKITELRIFTASDGKMNLSLKDIKGSHLIVSQFTLLGDTRQGRRPSFLEAEAPARARELYETALKLSEAQGVPTLGGIFQSHMEVAITNDGPVTFIMEL